ncbi:MAG TPA: tRNA (adenosine(37)-N6)-dimethylallyltransferase MiaA [Feifaniaceae bacterium]|nr:tRNA (adenosine(37)-N6)-dimethylallyltransferase MiaA [Feifaniaceae bacterium]
MGKKPHILILLGPTASGKTAASVLLAKKLNAEIISADSIQVYKGLDIGSAKPTMEERQGIEHHLIDVADVDDTSFSVAEYKRQAEFAIADIRSRGKTPLVVGGTGLYVNALTYPLQFTNVPGDPLVRERLQLEEREHPGSLYRRLQLEDPASAARLHPNDRKRVVRALEVLEVSGRPLSSFGADFENKARQEIDYHVAQIGLTMERVLLYQRIEQRVDDMMRSGLLEETKKLHEAGYAHTLPALQGLGYKQLLRHLRGETALEEAVEEIKRETRRFAKRQVTWFKRDQRIRWLDVTQYRDLDTLTDEMAAIYMGDEGETV